MNKWAEEDLRAQRKRDGIDERELPVEVTPSGIPGWHLNTPTWAEGSGKKATTRMKRKRKTTMCISWMQARARPKVRHNAGIQSKRDQVGYKYSRIPRWELAYSNATIEGHGTFGTATVFGCASHVGKGYYEVELLTDGVIQLGWADASFEADDEEGDAKWTNGVSATFGSKWVAGDIIGCCVDIDAGTIGFARNGVEMGVAFTDVRPSEKSESTYGGLFPAFSLEAKERIRINIGDHTFAFKTKNDDLAVLDVLVKKPDIMSSPSPVRSSPT
ncbi:hypothetical protein Ae201684_012300 [Aphanomyces euteiches]|uniref:B30.2/SPRY domain-containing protein n=1 Tax=Aphanomyces euteiches TaxID=100861 RepID=A0A6G0WS96_9STRA|nr:hypothetical protein Ae201684_012300 [Aphanomyces euteiches]KAH9139254.1 hypothetical protein AeRB84_016454 [Aphanomyces euteiches]